MAVPWLALPMMNCPSFGNTDPPMNIPMAGVENHSNLVPPRKKRFEIGWLNERQ